MSVKFKLSMVMLGVLATVGVSAYPLSVYIGKTIYENELDKVIKTNNDVTLLSSTDGLTSKNDSIKLVYKDNNGKVNEFYFDVHSEFGLTGVDSKIVLNYEKGAFAKIVNELKTEGLQEVPDIDLHVGYKVFGDKVFVDASIGKAVISNYKYSCVSEGAKWTASNSREAVLSSYKKTAAMLLDGIATGQYNISIPFVECQATDGSFSGTIKGVSLNGVLSGKTVSVIDWEISNVKLTSEQDTDIALNDVHLKSELIKNDSNNTFGYGVQLAVKESKVLLSQLPANNGPQVVDVTDFNFHNQVINLTPAQIEDYIKMSLDLNPNISNYNFGTQVDLLLKDLSAKVNGNDLKVNGNVTVNLDDDSNALFMESKGDLDIKLSQKIVELFGGQQAVEGLILFVDNGHIDLKDGFYSTKVSLKEGHIYLNDKRFL